MDIFLSIISNDILTVYNLLEVELNDANERNDQGLTGLHICATYGLVDMAMLLLHYGASTSLKDFESGYTPLHRSLYFGHLKLSWLLIRHGALLDISPDEHAAFSSKTYAKLSMKSSESNNCRDKEGFSPLGLLSTVLRERNSYLNYPTHINALVFGKADYQLGITVSKSVTDITAPKLINGLADESLSHVSTNKHHSLALTSNGLVYSWGHGKNGRLGHGNELLQLEPKLIYITNRKIISICTGLNHSLALCVDGQVYSWGSDRFGQLGHGLHNSDTGICTTPKRIENLKKDRIVSIAAGELHSICCSQSGDIYSWGSNKSGQLALKPTDITSSQSGNPICPYPKRVDLRSIFFKGGYTINQIAAAYTTTMLLVKRNTSDSIVNSDVNDVIQWGNGCPSPVRVLFPSHTTSNSDIMMGQSAIVIKQISAGKYHNVAVSSQGYVYTWGLGADQLGHSVDSGQYSPPKLVEALLPERICDTITYVEATSNRTCAVSSKGDLYTWGTSYDHGILSHNSNTIYQPIPKRVQGIKRAVKVAAAEDHTIVLTSFAIPRLPLTSFVQDQVIRSNDGNESSSDSDSDSDSDEENGGNDVSKKGHVRYPCNIPTLKQLCERRLASMVDSRTLPFYFEIADSCNATLLKSFCEEYNHLNFDGVLTQVKESELDALTLDHTFDRIMERIGLNMYLKNIREKDTKMMKSSRSYRSRSLSMDSTKSNDKSSELLFESKEPTKLNRSKDFDSTESISRAMKAVRKKLNSIQELSNNSQTTTLTRDQMEKLNKRTVLESELNRLTLIYNRIAREEEIKQKAVLLRQKNDSEDVLPESTDDDWLNDLDMSMTPSQSPDMVRERLMNDPSGWMSFEEDRKGIHQSNGKKAFPSQEISKNPSSQSNENKSSQSVSLKNSNHPIETSSKVKASSISIDKDQTIPNKSIPQDLDISNESTPIKDNKDAKNAWNISANNQKEKYSIADISNNPSISALHTKSPSSSSSSSLSSSSIPLSSMNVNNGQTVLSPMKHRQSMPYPHATLKTNPPVNKKQSTDEDVESMPSVGSNFTLASFIPDMKTPEKTLKAISSTSTPFKWGTSGTKQSSSISDPCIQSSPLDSSTASKKGFDTSPMSLWTDTPVSNTTMSSSIAGGSINPSSSSMERSTPQKSLVDIQREEEDMKRRSAMSYGKVSNAWYVERRARAPSIDEVMRIQEAQRIEEEKSRQDEWELQEALRLIAEQEQREQLERSKQGKKEKTKQMKKESSTKEDIGMTKTVDAVGPMNLSMKKETSKTRDKTVKSESDAVIAAEQPLRTEKQRPKKEKAKKLDTATGMTDNDAVIEVKKRDKLAMKPDKNVAASGDQPLKKEQSKKREKGPAKTEIDAVASADQPSKAERAHRQSKKERAEKLDKKAAVVDTATMVSVDQPGRRMDDVAVSFDKEIVPSVDQSGKTNDPIESKSTHRRSKPRPNTKERKTEGTTNRTAIEGIEAA